MLVESVLLTLAIAAWRKAGQKGQWNAKREEMYQGALKKLRDPEKLIKLADLLEKDGHHAKAYVLRKRAQLRATTEEQKKLRRDAFEKGMKSEKIDAILALAKVFEGLTATGAAKALRDRATYLRQRNADAEVKQWKADDAKKAASSDLAPPQVEVKEEPPTTPDKPSTIPAPVQPQAPTPPSEVDTEEEIPEDPSELESDLAPPQGANGAAHA
jgi:hypothetical protein